MTGTTASQASEEEGGVAVMSIARQMDVIDVSSLPLITSSRSNLRNADVAVDRRRYSADVVLRVYCQAETYIHYT